MGCVYNRFGFVCVVFSVLVGGVCVQASEPQLYNGPGLVSPHLPGVFTVPFGEQGREQSNVTRGTPSQILFGKYMRRSTWGHFRVELEAVRAQIQEVQAHARDVQKWSGSSKRAFVTFEASVDELNSALRFGAEINRRVDAGSLSLKSDEDLNADLPLLQDFYESLLQGLEIYDNLRADDTQAGTFSAVVDSLEGNAGRTYIRSNIPEAVNTLGLLDPKSSGFWSQPDPNYDTRNYNRSTQKKVGENLLAPDVPLEAEFVGAWGGSGVTPKLRAQIRLPSEKEPVDVKLKLRVSPASPISHSAGFADLLSSLRNSFSEVSVETAANNLAASIGYRIQPTYTKNQVRLYLPEDKSLGARAAGSVDERKAQAWAGFVAARKEAVRKFQKASLSGSGSQIDWNYEAALSDVDFDTTKNRWYIKLPQSSIELREDTKTGFFARHRFGRVLKREFRAFEIFGALIYDVDRKDSNSGTLLQKIGDRWKIKYVATDMGSSFGFVFFLKDAVNFFPADLVPLKYLQSLKTASRAKEVTIPLNFKPMFLGPMLNAVSVNDAKWLVGKLLKLSDAQFRGAFEGAGYHQCLVDLFTAKMLRRTHQLALAVGMGNSRTQALRVDEPFQFQASSECLPYMKGNDIVTPPAGATSDQLLSAKDLGGPNSLQREVGVGLANVGSIMGGAIASTWVDRLQVNFGNWLSGLDGTPGGRGVGLVVPLTAIRVTLENPFYRNSKALGKKLEETSISSSPYWIADVFRCGQGVNSSAAQALGFLPMAQSDLRLVKVRELIRIRSAGRDVIPQAYGKIQELADFPALKAACLGLDQDFIKMFTMNESLIQTDYFVFGAAQRARGLLQPGPNAAASLSLARSNRIVAMKADSEGLLVLRQKASSQKMGLEGNLSVVLAQLPLLGVSNAKIAEKQEMVLLKSADPMLLNRIMDVPITTSLTVALGKDALLAPETLEEKISNSSTTSFYASLLGLRTRFSSKNQTRIELTRCTPTDPQADCDKMSFDQKVKVSGQKGWNLFSDGGPRRTSADRYIAGGLQTSEGMTTYFSFVYKKLFANRQDLVQLLKRLKKIYPSSMVPIDPEDENQVRRLNDNQGELGFEGPFVISQDGWVHMFEQFNGIADEALLVAICRHALTQFSFVHHGMCEETSLQRLRDPNHRIAIARRAAKPESMARALYFISNFSSKLTRAILEYRKVSPLQGKTTLEMLPLRDRALDLLNDFETLEFTISGLQKLVGQDGYRFLSPRITSSLESLGLMGSDHELREDQEGALQVTNKDLTLGDQAWTAADFMFAGLAPYLYDYDRVLRVGINQRAYGDWLYVNTETANRARKNRQIRQ